MLRRVEGRRRKIIDCDDNCVANEDPLFGRINGAPICGIYLHITPTKNRRKERNGTEAQNLIQGECKVFWNKTTYLCSK